MADGRDHLKADDSECYRVVITRTYTHWHTEEQVTEVYARGSYRTPGPATAWRNRALKDPDTVSAVVQRGVTVWEDIT